MTADEQSQDRESSQEYEVRLLRDMAGTVRSIDNKVEDILDELKEHFQRQSPNEWSPRDLYESGDSY